MMERVYKNVANNSNVKYLNFLGLGAKLGAKLGTLRISKLD